LKEKKIHHRGTEKTEQTKIVLVKRRRRFTAEAQRLEFRVQNKAKKMLEATQNLNNLNSVPKRSSKQAIQGELGALTAFLTMRKVGFGSGW
jgi:hypothetical protein